MGGLSAAAFLSRAGYRVLVLDQHYRSGGYAHSFRRRQFTFDSAVRIVAGAEHGLLGQLLKMAGVKEQLDFIPLEHAYAAHYPDFTVTVPSSVAGFIEAHARLFPSEREAIQALAQEMLRIYEAVLGALRHSNTDYLLSNPYILKYNKMQFSELVHQYVKEPKAASALSSLWAYYGAPPSQGSALFFAYAIMSYFVEGIYYLRGSFQKLADAFVGEIERNGGEVRLANPVERILVEQRRVTGVEVKHGGVISAPLVISNADLWSTCTQLVGVEHWGPRFLKRLERLTVAVSCFEVFIGTDMPLEAFGLAHETFVFDRYEHDVTFANHSRLKELGLAGLSGFAMSSPSLVDSSLAPPGNHTLVLTTLAPYAISGAPEGWREMKPLFTQCLVDRAEQLLPGLKAHIQVLDAGSPMTMERYTRNRFGSPYGWEQSLHQTRPGPQTPIEGLHLVGHWTEPGGGVVSVLLSGYRLACRILGRSTAVPELQIAGR